MSRAQRMKCYNNCFHLQLCPANLYGSVEWKMWDSLSMEN